ncbi:GGDEF domain-containing protein [Metabacillus sediminilitoris]|uniref:GGDEF domain-containing protein n=1 Tax=Metabacillus sediminilitoris TaxID=2567941 RepID=UPI0018B0CA29|nr:GGDEF domain-containing protein [Metabacillus sediminilitoris]
MIENKVVQEVLKGNNGHQEVVNSKGNTMLAGYSATAGDSNWGIISQTPKISVNEPIIQMVKKVSFTAIPFMIFIFLISFLLLKKIVNPIRKLAVYAQQVTEQKTIPTPHIPDWYFELKELKRGIFVAVDFYQKKLNDVENEAVLDPLTGFYNRRTLESTIKRLDMYSIILFDIDHFKNVNDKYGHQKGEEVLKFISSLVKKELRETELCYRLGGEEFLIVLPETNGSIAHSIAERIREAAATTKSPTGNPITLSMGIGNIPEIAQSFEELFHAADQALYEAKQLDRNRVKAAKTNLIN